MSDVLVTGGSGFLGSHCILRLLQDGFSVRTTVRDLRREPEVRAMLRAGGAEPGARLRFFAADLERDAGWADAVAGCAFVLHTASPFPVGAPKHEDDLLAPARDGTLRVLRAARDAGVKRVVVTSSFGAIGYGHPPRTAAFTEADWTNVDHPEVNAYVKSKVLAERAAWDFAREPGAPELTVTNPVGIFGPVLGPDYSASIAIIRNLLDGGMRVCPKLYFGVVDVRDVAALHVTALTHPAAAGQRFIAASGAPLSLFQVARILRRHLGPAAARVPRFELPTWLARLAARRDPKLRGMLPQLGKIRRASAAKARDVLGWAPRSADEAIVATAESLRVLAGEQARRR